MYRKSNSRNTTPHGVRTGASQNSECQHAVDLLERELQDLNQALGRPEGRRHPSKKFTEWAVKVADESYPGIGQTARAAPFFFCGNHKVEKYEPGNTQLEPQASASASGAAGKDDGDGHHGGGSAGKQQKGPSLLDAGRQFVVSTLPENTQRGDAAQRILGRAFRILNSRLEEGGKATMFIISQYEYVNLLSWIRKPDHKKAQEYFDTKKFPMVFGKVPGKPSYINCEGLHELCKDRGEVDLMVLHPDKGILLLQIKSISREAQTGDGSGATEILPDEKILEKLKAADEQLSRDVKILEKVMDESQHWGEKGKVTRVIAVPGLSRAELDVMKVGQNFKPEIQFLCREQMMEETAGSIVDSEAESNIEGLQEWWKELPNVSLSLECIKEIVGKYVGPLSAVVNPNKGRQKPLYQIVLMFDQCVRQVALLSNRLLLTPTQRAIVETRTKGQRRVYISGPPGSGKTLLLMLRSLAFIKESPTHQVVVVNMYPGASGRAIGKSITNSIRGIRQNADPLFKGERVHHLPINLHENDFVQKVKDLLSKPPEPGKKTSQYAGARPKTRSTHAGGDSTRKEITKGQTREGDLKSMLKNVLFIVDEIYVAFFWEAVWKAFKEEFAVSEVWCAGMFSTNPDGFVEHELDIVLRCPPAVQNLLYHVDWNERRKEKYRRDTQWLEVSSNGPVPLCIRHTSHGGCEGDSASSVHPILDCGLCAQQLASLLKKADIVRNATRIMSAPVKSTSKQAAPRKKASSTAEFHDRLDNGSGGGQLKVTILVNLHRSSYQPEDRYITSTMDSYRSHMEKVKGSDFITTLQRQPGIQVVVKDSLGDKELQGASDGGVQVTWIYNFQGLETDVVIFLPGDPSPPAGEHRQDAQREIPTPGLKAVSDPGQVTPNPGPSSSSTPHSSPTVKASDAALLQGTKTGGPQPAPTSLDAAAGGGGGQESVLSLSGLQWRKEDIQRFSDWDRTNILVAGSRTLSLLILLVP